MISRLYYGDNTTEDGGWFVGATIAESYYR